MTTPFEIFRTPITLYRNFNGFYYKGRWRQGSMAQLDSDLVTGNSIVITLDSVILPAIVFTTDHETTMELIKTQLEAQLNVKAVALSGTNNRDITVTPDTGENVYFDDFVITGGASQPLVTLSDTPEIIPITASIQPLQAEDMQELPEGRYSLNGYKMFTSTRIYTVTEQNPDQVEIFSERYEIVRVFPWQNNSNFTTVNHYKYLTLKLENT